MTNAMNDGQVGGERAVLEAEQRRCAAMLSGDTAALAGLMDPRLHFIHANGSVDDRDGYLAKIDGGRIRYLSIEWSERRLIALDGAFLLAGRMSTHVTVEGVDKRLENRVLTVWANEAGWRLVAFQSTPLGK